MKIDHIGYAVKNIDKSIQTFCLLGFNFESIIKDDDRNIYIAFGRNGEYIIELVSPISSGSPIDDVLKKNGSTPYHICYRSDNYEDDIAILLQKRFKIIIPPEKAIAFGGKRVVFMYNPVIGLIEIVEK